MAVYHTRIAESLYFGVRLPQNKRCLEIEISLKMSDEDDWKAGIGAAVGGIIGFSALLVLVLYIMGKIYNISLGEIFGQIRDGFRDSKPKLQ
ncbi:hypothetical protein BBBOND_0303050 [Babesia bigemina]|uniref:Uncharacterized protein n=1 Tax=Babesia bigemina TaxID=5866 RepID=A0A061D6S8_BABBI|nr:hypothetical protein BBBOND_0303050 [Babesia bigemina]CDR96401.1 hypothetical protein BBBOND_0303050 [Babesia bigemina]|eukprot:XP_012768587.1 hypothetical protein BBBOND_0303050 [Babesia bigemina]